MRSSELRIRTSLLWSSVNATSGALSDGIGVAVIRTSHRDSSDYPPADVQLRLILN